MSKASDQTEHEPKATLLIVDDNPENLSVLSDFLGGYDYRILTAESGERALEVAAKAMPELILLDIMMDGIDGYETCRELKLGDTTRHIPVIFLTALSEPGDKVKGFEVGAVDYLTKPLNQSEVLARVKTHLTIQRLQQRLAAKVEQLDEALREREVLIRNLDAYAHTVAHDIKSPLGVICGMADAILKRRKPLTEEQLHDRLGSISRSGWKLQSIVEELLLLSGMDSDSAPRSQLDMQAIVEQALARLSELTSGARLELTITGEWPATIGYAPWIEEVWINYLSNAVKYGGMPPQVEIGNQDVGDYIEFYVRDNGKGITKKDLARLFKPHERLENSTPDGHGLGLSIVKRIVERLDGDVRASSQRGQGSVFYFSLPKA